jgi:hypothetical protein
MAALRREVDDVATGMGLVEGVVHRREPELIELQVREALVELSFGLRGRSPKIRGAVVGHGYGDRSQRRADL